MCVGDFNMDFFYFAFPTAFVGVLAWAAVNQWLLKRMVADQKRVMAAHQADTFVLFEQQVTDAVRALLLQGSGDKFVLQARNAHNYVVVRGRKQVVRLCFHSDLTVLLAVEWKDGGQQQVFTFQEIAGLYSVVITQVGQYSAFDTQYGGVGTHHRRPNVDGLAHLALVHTNGK